MPLRGLSTYTGRERSTVYLLDGVPSRQIVRMSLYQARLPRRQCLYRPAQPEHFLNALLSRIFNERFPTESGRELSQMNPNAILEDHGGLLLSSQQPQLGTLAKTEALPNSLRQDDAPSLLSFGFT